MKSLTYLTTLFLFSIPFAASTQNSGIDAALSKGNAADLGIFFASQVDVSITNTDEVLQMNEAVMRLKDFFSKNMVKGYNRVHYTGASNGRSAYSLGDLYTSTGNYRLYLYFDGSQKISEIRIEK